MVLFGLFMVFADVSVNLPEILLDYPSVNDKVADDGKFPERLYGDHTAFEVSYKSIACEPRNIVYYHCAAAAHAL